MENTSDAQLVVELSRDVLAQVAPQELPLFRAASEVYRIDSAALARNARKTDEMLGFGPGEAAALLTPAILLIMDEVVRFLAEEIKKSIQEQSAGLISEAVKALFKKFRSAENTEPRLPPPLTAEQLAQVRAIALKQARNLKLSDTNTKLLADSIVGSLAVASAK